MLEALGTLQEKTNIAVRTSPLAGVCAYVAAPRTVRRLGEPTFRLMAMRGHASRIDLSQVRHLLLIRPDEIGDVVLVSPLLRELRRNLPCAFISLVVSPSAFDLVEHCPYVNQVIAFPWAKARWPWPYYQLDRHRQALTFARAHFWPRRFDLALVPRWEIDFYHASFLAYFSGAPWRVGYSRHVSPHKSRHNDGLDVLYTHLLHDAIPKHEIQHNLDVLRYLGGDVADTRLELFLTAADRAFARDLLEHQQIYDSARPLVAICPGAGAARRQWPVERFAELARRFMLAGADLLLLGGPADKPLADQIMARLPTGRLRGPRAVHVAGALPLRHTAALLEHCRLYAGNDTGPTHLAAAAGARVVQISCHPRGGDPAHFNSPHRFGPWSDPASPTSHRVLQPEPVAPCVHACDADVAHCIMNLSVDQVWSAAQGLLASSEAIAP